MKPQLPTRQAILDRRTYEPPGEGRADKLRLDFNENTAGCSPKVQRALAKLTPKLLSMYPEYDRGTRRLARHFRVVPEELLLTNGGDDALRLFFDAFVDAGTTAVICEPTFPMYRYWGEIAGARLEVQRYSANMEFPLDGVLQSLAAKPRVLFVCNPNNPTGTLLQSVTIETILQAATHTAVVLDEAYAEFSGVTLIPLVNQYAQLFVARTFSKAAGLAGLRLGAVIACAESLTVLRRATAPFPVNVAALAAAEAAVGDSRTMKLYVKSI
ncbi:MAG: histidinol-phosphate transaminase, partial [Candidatus Acidiferrum sp.]